MDGVECRLKLGGVAVDEIGEDAALGSLVDELGVFRVEHEDHRAGRTVGDLLDQLERVLGAFAEADERDVRVLGARSLGDVVDVQLERYDLVSERAGDLGDGLGTLGQLVGD